MMNHLRTSQSNITLFLILSYLVPTFFIQCCQINSGSLGKYTDKTYHFHTPLAYDSQKHRASKEAEHHDNDHHCFASHLDNPAFHVKIFDHSSFSQGKKEKPASHTSKFIDDTKVSPFKANRHYALRRCFPLVSHSQQVLAFFNTNLSPPVS